MANLVNGMSYLLNVVKEDKETGLIDAQEASILLLRSLFELMVIRDIVIDKFNLTNFGDIVESLIMKADEIQNAKAENINV